MEFITKMIVSDEEVNLLHLSRVGEEMMSRSFDHILFDDFSLSIQASYAHYCIPRKTLKDLKEYAAMEFALLKEGEFISVRELLPDFKRLFEIESYHDTVYGYVPVDLIEDMFQEFKKKYF